MTKIKDADLSSHPPLIVMITSSDSWKANELSNLTFDYF